MNCFCLLIFGFRFDSKLFEKLRRRVSFDVLECARKLLKVGKSGFVGNLFQLKLFLHDHFFRYVYPMAGKKLFGSISGIFAK